MMQKIVCLKCAFDKVWGVCFMGFLGVSFWNLVEKKKKKSV
jgi:hypothetical protein